MRYIFLTTLFLVDLILSGCTNHYQAKTPHKQYQSLLESDTKVEIEGLGRCYDNLKGPIEFNSKKPITILVHGCYASSGEFRSLSQVLAFHEQQSFCFRYDDRDSLKTSATKLTQALNELAKFTVNSEINIIAHSMGGLIARKALVKDSTTQLDKEISIKIATVSTPFSGINAAKTCANPFVRITTLGIHDLACWMISGDKWYEITPASNFIHEPGELSPQVSQHLLIATDEQNSCRYRDANDKCLEDDYVFSLHEQKLSHIDQSSKRRDITIQAGHVEVVGKYDHSAQKLIQVLQAEGFIHPTPQPHIIAFHTLVERLFANKQL